MQPELIHIKSEDESTIDSSFISTVRLTNYALQGEYLLKTFVFQNNIYNVDSDITIPFNYAATNRAGILTSGFYTASELASHMQSIMNTESGTSNFTVTLNSKTGKFTWTSAVGEFTLTIGTERIRRLLGFTSTGAKASASLTLTSDMLITMSYPKMSINVKINDSNHIVDNNDFACTFNIPMTVGYGLNEVFQAEDRNKIVIDFGTQPKKNIKVQFLDADDEPVNTQGLFEIVLQKIK